MIDVSKLKKEDTIWAVRASSESGGVEKLKVVDVYHPDDDESEPLVVMVDDGEYEHWSFSEASPFAKMVFETKEEAENHFNVLDIIT